MHKILQEACRRNGFACLEKKTWTEDSFCIEVKISDRTYGSIVSVKTTSGLSEEAVAAATNEAYTAVIEKVIDYASNNMITSLLKRLEKLN